jgi:chloramphenicol-sensitive protein RarD
MQNKGLVYALTSFVMWGFFPIYWKLLGDFGSNEILAHRIVWGSLAMLAFILLVRQWRALQEAIFQPKMMFITLFAASLMGINWWLNIYAAHAGKIAEASMGYYITPLLNVLLGAMFYKERLRPLQGLAIVIAALGVLVMIIQYGQVPYLAIYLAGSFALYGAAKKKLSFPAGVGMALESWMLLLPAGAYLLFFQTAPVLNHSTTLTTQALLYMSGPVSILPLIFFAAAAQRTSLTTLGIIQYLAPTISFFVAIGLYGETLTQGRLIAFIGIWCGVLIFSTEAIWFNKTQKTTNL